MKRGKPLERRTALRAKPPTPEERRAKQQAAADRARARRAERLAEAPPRIRSAPPPKKPKPRKAPDPTPDPVTPEVRAEVAVRSRGYCEARVAPRCVGRGQHVHHRKLRRHGDHRAVNLLHVCYACHDAIHSSWYAATAYARRFLLRAYQDPEAEPVRRAA